MEEAFHLQIASKVSWNRQPLIGDGSLILNQDGHWMSHEPKIYCDSCFDQTISFQRIDSWLR